MEFNELAATVEMTGVTLSRNEKPLLKDIKLSAREKRIGIVGRNGSGKTTFARVLSGLVAPDQGEVRICGIDVAKDRKAALRTVGILFQNPDHQIIFPTVEEELGFGLIQMGCSKHETEHQVYEVLKAFDKGTLGQNPNASTFSGAKAVGLLDGHHSNETQSRYSRRTFLGLRHSNAFAVEPLF